MKLENKVVWITGASSGMGEATAYQLTKYKCNLILSSNQERELEEVKEKCEKLGSKCFTLPFDLLENNKLPSYVEKALSFFGKIDVFFNNGGISQRALVTEAPIEIDRKIMEINFFSGATITKALLPSMIENGGGQIVVTTSIAGKFGFPYRSAYCSSKHALYGFYETVRAELTDKNIKVTFICPGRVRTNISIHALNKEGKEHGKMDDGQNFGLPVEKAVKQIVRAIIKNKRDVLIGGKELLMVHFKKWLPFIFYRLVTKINPT